ncbi:uncharacterized protein CCR75_002405 [Bremia lactucae]|uniref:Cdc23 domain-containing protein n=1 Tax=Bremia lactucae TaxID=4779 RepID=A0A976IKG0_BRELC|nr:hypothetical protein CCR75_002405 [Bremia lactucae]
MHEMAEQNIAAQLRCATHDLRVRGLKQATKFAAELLLGMSSGAPIWQSAMPNRSDEANDKIESFAEADRFEAAKACFDLGEYLRAHHLLLFSELWCNCDETDAYCSPTQKTCFLKYYSLYLVT